MFKCPLSLLGATLVACVSSRPAPQADWFRDPGGAGRGEIGGVAAGANGVVFAVGHTEEGTFIAAYDTGGAQLWSRKVDGGGKGRGYAIALDGRGGVVAAGGLGEGDELRCFVSSLDAASGRERWTIRSDGAGQHYCRAVAIDGGDVVLAGHFTGTLKLAAEAFDSRGKGDIFLARLEGQSGAVRWVRRFGGKGNDIARAVAVIPGGDIVLGGQFSGEVPPADGEVDFGGGALRSRGDFDALIARFTAEGLHIWSRSFGDTGFDIVKSVIVDGGGDIFASGALMRPQGDWGGQPPLLAGVMDGFISRWSADGRLLWQRLLRADKSQAHALALDGAGRIWVAGHFVGTLELGERKLPVASDNSTFIAAFSPLGEALWGRSFFAGYAYAIAPASNGRIALGGVRAGAGGFVGCVAPDLAGRE